MSNNNTHPEVSIAIEEYFKQQGLTHRMVAKILGVTPQAVSRQIKQPFGKNVSGKWAKALGFNIEFLTSGKGKLIPSDDETTNNTCNKQLDENYRDQLESFIKQAKWGSTDDYENARKLIEISLEVINRLIAERDYYEIEYTTLKEENKRLFVENSTLKRNKNN